MNQPTNLQRRSPSPLLLIAGIVFLTSLAAQASLSIVTQSDYEWWNGGYQSNYGDDNFYTITYDANSTNGASLTQLQIDLRGGTDTNAVWDAGGSGGYYAYNWGESSGVSSGDVTLEYDNGGRYLTIDFAEGYFNPGDVFTFGYDTDNLGSNEGGDFGEKGVTVDATWDTGDTSYGTFQKNNTGKSTATLDNAVINGGGGTNGGGSIATTFSANDVVGDRGDNIPFDIDLTGNENTSAFYITGLPEGFRLSEGGNIGYESWIVDYTDIGLVEIISPATYVGQFVLDVKQDTSNSISEAASGTFSSGNGARAATSSSYTEFAYAGSNANTVSDGQSILCHYGNEGNSGWANLQDRTDSGYGYFMVANADGTEKVLFEETLNLGINSEFRVSAFLSNITSSSMAQVSFRINGQEIMNSGLIDSWDGTGVSQWEEFNTTHTTSSVNTAVTFEIVSTGDGVIALDDVVFAAAYSDDMLVTIHDIGKTDSPIYYTFSFTNNNAVPMPATFVDVLPLGLAWDTDYEIQDAGGLVVPTPLYSVANTKITLTGLVLPPGTTELTMRTQPPGLAGAGDYTNLGTVTVGGEDFYTQVFTATSTFTVAATN